MATRPILAFLVRMLVPKRYQEFVLGDLDELRAARARRDGRTSAGFRYLLDVLGTLAAFGVPGRRRLARGGSRSRSTPLPGEHEARPGHDPRRRSALSVVLEDLRAALRAMRRRPGFTTVAALTLAIGVGSAAAGFGMVNQLLLRPLPGVADPRGAAYVRFFPVDDPNNEVSVSLPDFDALRRAATLVDGIGAYSHATLHVSMGDERPVEVWANLIYGDFFEILGVVPAAGRLLTEQETAPGAADPYVAVISERLWASMFGGAPDVVGRTLRAGATTLTVVGVAGGGFSGPERGFEMDLWIPRMARIGPGTLDRLMSREVTFAEELVVRPSRGASPQAVELHLATIWERIAPATPESAEELRNLRPRVFPGLHLPPGWRQRTYGSLALVGGVVGLVLLISCANVANLLLFRSVGRRAEVATRRALGASSGRVARQHLAESLMIAAAGTVLGLGMGWLVALPFRGLVGPEPFEGLVFDGRVLLFAGASVLVTAALFGTLPALLAGRFDLGGALREAGGRETGRGSGLRAAMSATQIALSLVLLVGAFLLVRTVGNLYAVDTGLSIERVSALNLDLDDFPDEERDAVHRRLLAAVGAVPGVEAAALDVYGPHAGASMGGWVGLPSAPDAERVGAGLTFVSPGWFEVLGVEPVRGRTFRSEDWEPGAPPRLVITAGLARRLFGTTEAVGRRLVAGFTSRVEGEVVGVVGDVRLGDPDDEPRPMFFQLRTDFPVSTVSLLARTRVPDAAQLLGIRKAVESAVPDLPVPDAVPLVDRLHDLLQEQRTFAQMIALLGALAALLAAVGLYGVVAFTMAGRRRELGIRLALGADGRKIVGLVARYALGIVGLGTATGLAAAYGLSRLLESRLFGVAPADPASYAGSALLFAAVAAAACWTPTRSAMRVDPVVTLRSE